MSLCVCVYTCIHVPLYIVGSDLFLAASTGHVPYVLIGAGTASFAAAKAIRETDPQAKVHL